MKKKEKSKASKKNFELEIMQLEQKVAPDWNSCKTSWESYNGSEC